MKSITEPYITLSRRFPTTPESKSVRIIVINGSFFRYLRIKNSKTPMATIDSPRKKTLPLGKNPNIPPGFSTLVIFRKLPNNLIVSPYERFLIIRYLDILSREANTIKTIKAVILINISYFALKNPFNYQ